MNSIVDWRLSVQVLGVPAAALLYKLVALVIKPRIVFLLPALAAVLSSSVP